MQALCGHPDCEDRRWRNAAISLVRLAGGVFFRMRRSQCRVFIGGDAEQSSLGRRAACPCSSVWRINMGSSPPASRSVHSISRRSNCRDNAAVELNEGEFVQWRRFTPTLRQDVLVYIEMCHNRSAKRQKRIGF